MTNLCFTSINKDINIILKIELKNKLKENQTVLRISGDFLSFKYGDCSGQIKDAIKEHLKEFKKEHQKTLKQIIKLWDKYHLNDLNPDCKHKINEKLADKKIKIIKLRYTEEAKKLNKIRDFGYFKQFITVTEEGLKNIPSKLYELKTYTHSKNDAIEFKTARWVEYHPIFRPDGVLCKPCPKCGYKYGTSWNYEPIPKKDLQIINQIIKKGRV